MFALRSRQRITSRSLLRHSCVRATIPKDENEPEHTAIQTAIKVGEGVWERIHETAFEPMPTQSFTVNKKLS